MMCNAHAQLDDSFDDEYEVVNYNLAQVAELEAAQRIQAAQPAQAPFQAPAAATFNQSSFQNNNYNTGFDSMQIDGGAFAYNPHQQSYHHYTHQPQHTHMLGFGSPNSRKLKRSCESDYANANNNAEFERSNKRIKAAF